MFDESWRKINAVKLIERFSNDTISKRGFVEVLPLQVIWLTTLINICKQAERNSFLPLSSVAGKLSPTRELIQQIVNQLHYTGIIGISEHFTERHEESLAEELTVKSRLGVYFKESGYVIDPYLLYTHLPWKITVKLTEDQERILYSPVPKDFHISHRYIIWKTINAHEALEIFKECIKNISGEEDSFIGYLDILEEYLESYSLAQLEALFRKQAKRLSALKTVKNKTSTNFFTQIKNFLEEYDYLKEIQPQKQRSKSCSQSKISYFLSRRILGLYEDIYHKPPSISQLKKEERWIFFE